MLVSKSIIPFLLTCIGTKMRKTSLLIVALFFSQLLISCSAFKPDVQQGTTFDDEMLSQLKVGMTQQQVVFVMGSALLKDTFHKNRWDYLYTLAKGREKTERRLLTLYFKDNKVSKIDNTQIKRITLE